MPAKYEINNPGGNGGTDLPITDPIKASFAAAMGLETPAAAQTKANAAQATAIAAAATDATTKANAAQTAATAAAATDATTKANAAQAAATAAAATDATTKANGAQAAATAAAATDATTKANGAQAAAIAAAATDATTKANGAQAAAIAAAATDATTKANAAQAAATAAAATDATTKASGKANLTGGNIFTGPQQNTGPVSSTAALGADMSQLPTQAQVRSIIAPAYIEPIVDLNLAGWDRVTALLNSGSANSCNVTLTDTPLEVETTRGAGLDFGGGNKFGAFNAELTRRFNRIVNGRPFTLILEGDNLIPNTLVANSCLLSNFVSWSALPFIQIMSDPSIGGLVRLLIISSGLVTNVHLGISNYNALNANNITKIYATGSTNSPVVFYLEQQNGQRFVTNWGNPGSSSTMVSNTNTMANNLQLCRENSSAANSSAAKIARIRLYDRILDI